jgi:hypothetical protein
MLAIVWKHRPSKDNGLRNQRNRANQVADGGHDDGFFRFEAAGGDASGDAVRGIGPAVDKTTPKLKRRAT